MKVWCVIQRRPLPDGAPGHLHIAVVRCTNVSRDIDVVACKIWLSVKELEKILPAQDGQYGLLHIIRHQTE